MAIKKLSEKDIEVFEALREEYDDGYVSKHNAVMASNIYNRYNDNKISYCMCVAIKRKILGGEMLKWWDSLDEGQYR